MVVWIAWLAAVVIGVLILLVVGYGVLGSVRRLRGAMSSVQRDVLPPAISVAATLRQRKDTG